MKQLLAVCSLSTIAIAAMTIAGKQVSPCDPHNHICYVNGVNHSYFAHNNWNRMYGMTLHQDASGEPYLSSRKSTGPRPVAFYLGVLSGVNFVHASGTYRAQLYAPSIVADSFATSTSHTNWLYGAYMGLSFHAKNGSWINRLHPEVSFWNTNTAKITGIHQVTIATPTKTQYQYDLHVRALGLNALFDAVQWKDARVMFGGGANVAQLATANFQEKLLSGAPLYESVKDQTSTRVIFDIKAGVGVHFLNHVQANVMYTYYPTFTYRTGNIVNNAGLTTWPGIQAKMSLQSVVFKLAYTF